MKDVLGKDFIDGVDDEELMTDSALPEFRGLTSEQAAEKEQRIFREVFGTRNGQIVLTQILTDLKYFGRCNDMESTALSNYAKYLLQERLGINDTYKLTVSMLKVNKE